MEITVLQYVMTLSEKLYQSDGDKQIESIVKFLEGLNSLIANKSNISKENIEYLNVIISNILKAMEMKDWIFVGDILRYELKKFVEEV